MNLTNVIAQMILGMLDDDGMSEIQRNELAQEIGCVPSQINYVISSRFTPEHGYIVESRRGGGGYIRIQRANYDPDIIYMQVINSVGTDIDEMTARAHIKNLNDRDILSDEKARVMAAAVSDRSLIQVPPELKNKVRASLFKQLLLAAM